MRKLAIVLVMLVALGVAADRAAAYVAEGVVAQKIQDAEGIDDAAVDITGFPFLTQVLAGEFSAIEVSMPTVDASTGGGSVRVDELDVTFRDVVTSEGFSSAHAGSVTGSGSIEYDAFTGLGLVDVAYGGETRDGRGSLELSVGRGLTTRVVPTVLDGQTLGFAGSDGTTRIDPMPDALMSFALGRYALDGLPSGFEIESVEATRDGLELTVTGIDVPLA
jgi:hypothetical protein